MTTKDDEEAVLTQEIKQHATRSPCCATALISLVLHLLIFTVLHQLHLLRLLFRLHLTRSLLSLRFFVACH